MDNEFWASENPSAQILTNDAVAPPECHNPLTGGSSIMHPQQTNIQPTQQLPALQRTHHTAQLQQDFMEQQAAQQHQQQQQHQESAKKFERLAPTSRESIGVRARDLDKTDLSGGGLVQVDIGNPLRTDMTGSFSLGTLRSPQSLYAPVTPSVPQSAPVPVSAAPEQHYETPISVPVPVPMAASGTYISKTIINGDQRQTQEQLRQKQQQQQLEYYYQQQQQQQQEQQQHSFQNLEHEQENAGSYGAHGSIPEHPGYAVPSSNSSVAADTRLESESAVPVVAPPNAQNNSSSIWPWILAGVAVILAISVLVAAYIYQQKKSNSESNKSRSKISGQSRSKTEVSAKSQSEANGSRQKQSYQPATASRIARDTGDLVRATDATSS